MTKPAHHQVNVLRIENILPHNNADNLAIVPVFGFQAVVGKDQFRVGDLAYYIPPDSVVPDRPEFAFIWGNSTYEGGTPAPKRRVTARRFRKEWSEGVLMPCIEAYRDTLNGIEFYKPADFALLRDADGKQIQVVSGEDVSDFLGITHYDPPEPGESTQPSQNGQTKRWRWPRTYGGWKQLFLSWLRGERREGGIALPTYDVDNFKRYQNTFQAGELVLVTEKIHGSNARYCFKPGRFGTQGHMYAGSRNLWKAESSTCAWRRALTDNLWIEEWCRAHPNYALYGEITPTQKKFDYGSGDRVRFFLFDVRSPEGKWLDRGEIASLDHQNPLTGLTSADFVPTLYAGEFDLEAIMRVVDGPSTVFAANHIREGVVIKASPERVAPHLGRAQLKIVSNAYLEKSLKDAA